MKRETLKKAIGNRLRLARTAAGFRTAKEFAVKNDIPQPTYSFHESGGRGLREDVVIHYAALLGVSPSWLLTGEGDGPLDRASSQDHSPRRAASHPPHRGAPAAKPAGEWGFPDGYLQHELRVTKTAVQIVTVADASMEPTLAIGDRVMVNSGDKTPSPPGVFAIWDGFGLVLKRLEFVPNSSPAMIVISADNPKHGRHEQPANDLDIRGRVVWVGRRI